jgi:hypothetical protein
MINVQIGGGLQPTNAPVENLGKDLANLFGAVSKGVETYNTIGETAAKLQYQTDALEYNKYVSDIKSSLAFATRPEEYIEANRAIETLSAEFVAKSDKFSGHEFAYDYYRNSALQSSSSVVRDFDSITANGVEKTMIANNNNNIDTVLSVSGKNIVPAQVDAATAVENAILGNSFLGQSKLATGHIQAVNKDVIGMTDEYIGSQIANGNPQSGFVVDQDKKTAFLNSLFGKNELVKYSKDKDGTITVSSSAFNSPEVLEKYAKQIDAFDSTIARLNSGVHSSGDGAFKVLQGTTKPIAIGGSISSIEDSIRTTNVALKNYNETKTSQTPVQNATIAVSLSENMNTTRKLETMLEAYKVGGDLSTLKYVETQAKWNPLTEDTDIEDSVNIQSISLEDANKFRDARIVEIVDLFKRGKAVPPQAIEFTVRNHGIDTVVNGFKNSLIAGIPMLNNISDIKAFKSNIDVISSRLGIASPIVQQLSAEINANISTAEAHPANKDVQRDSISKINREISSIGKTLAQLTTATSEFKTNVVKSLSGDNGIFVWDRKTLPATVDSAFAILYDKFHMTPTQDAVVEYVRENGVNINNSFISYLQDDMTVLNPSYKTYKNVGKKRELVDAKLTNSQFVSTIDYILSTPEYKNLKDIKISNSPSADGAITIFAGGSPHPVGVFDGANLQHIYSKNYKKMKNKKPKIMDTKNQPYFMGL